MSNPKLVLNLSLQKFAASLNIAHTNVCSLYGKITQVREILSNSHVHALCLTETWLSCVHTNQMANIDGFALLRHDRNRTGRRSSPGGVCIYLAKYLKVKIIAKSDVDSALEFFFFYLD